MALALLGMINKNLLYASALPVARFCSGNSNNNDNNNISNLDWLTIRVKELSVIKTPLKIYPNFKDDKLLLVKDHKIENTTGIYYFINLINGHCYIGCSKNISQRMLNYLLPPAFRVI